MDSTPTPVFAVLFSVKFDNVNLISQMRLLRKLAKYGAGSGVEMIDAVVFPNNQTYCCFVIGKAQDLQVVEAAVADSRRDFDVQIVPVAGYTHHEEVGANYCVFGFSKAEGNTEPEGSPGRPAAERLRVDFGPGGKLRSLWLVQAPSPAIARRHATEQQPDLFFRCTAAVNAIAYSNNLGNSVQAAVPTLPLPPASDTPILADGSAGVIYNESSAAAWFSEAKPSVLDPNNTSLDFYNLLKARQQAAPATPYPVQASVYAWSSNTGTFTYDLEYPDEITEDPQYIRGVPLNTNCPLPAIATPYLPGVTLGFNLSAGAGFHVRTDLSQWLNNVVNTTKHDEEWPEDDPSWPEGYKKAYSYWIKTLLSGDPRQVVIDPATVNNKYLDPGYPSNADFSQDDFKFVYQHLYDECDAISKCNRWYGVAGIMNAINTNVAGAATDSLISTSSLMQIPQQTGQVMVILGAIISDISSVVGAIPGIGNALEAGINVMWSAAATAQFGPGPASEPIQAGIAAMADMITNYRQSIDNARQKANGAINGNWGKLMEFHKNYPDPVQTDTLPDEYITEAARVWKVHFYKGLFAYVHGAVSEMELGQQATNSWNPAAGNYNYNYVLPGSFYDSKMNVVTGGFISFYCSTDAPIQVLQDLFGPVTAQTPAPLNINPFEFFAGFNGWPTVAPVLHNTDNRSMLISVGY